MSNVLQSKEHNYWSDLKDSGFKGQNTENCFILHLRIYNFGIQLPLYGLDSILTMALCNLKA